MQQLQLVGANGARDIGMQRARASTSSVLVAVRLPACFSTAPPEATLLTSQFEIEGPEIVVLVMASVLETFPSLAGRLRRQLS
eukprot:1869323-Lingulodinium_polyedra.AAC.1